jgi:hypothetical protein
MTILLRAVQRPEERKAQRQLLNCSGLVAAGLVRVGAISLARAQRYVPTMSDLKLNISVPVYKPP